MHNQRYILNVQTSEAPHFTISLTVPVVYNTTFENIYQRDDPLYTSIGGYLHEIDALDSG